MRQSAILLLAAAIGLCACGREAPSKPQTNVLANSVGAAPQEAASLDEPNGAIDTKSPEAAGAVVQSYGALIEQKRWQEANALWSDPSQAAKFQGRLARYGDVHIEIGNPGDLEGAAGSIYVTVPAIFYGDSNDEPFRRSADVALRRINDVPGSTEAQRRWHIERIDWTS
jgi:hypothetical protein